MRLFLCLFLLLSAGIALLVLPDSIFGLPKADTTHWAIRSWRETVTLISVPAFLLIATLLRARFVALFAFGWGSWIALLSIWILLSFHEALVGATWYGVAFIVAVLVASLGTALSVLTRMIRQPSNHSTADDSNRETVNQ